MHFQEENGVCFRILYLTIYGKKYGRLKTQQIWAKQISKVLTMASKLVFLFRRNNLIESMYVMKMKPDTTG